MFIVGVGQSQSGIVQISCRRHKHLCLTHVHARRDDFDERIKLLIVVLVTYGIPLAVIQHTITAAINEPDGNPLADTVDSRPYLVQVVLVAQTLGGVCVVDQFHPAPWFVLAHGFASTMHIHPSTLWTYRNW